METCKRPILVSNNQLLGSLYNVVKEGDIKIIQNRQCRIHGFTSCLVEYCHSPCQFYFSFPLQNEVMVRMDYAKEIDGRPKRSYSYPRRSLSIYENTYNWYLKATRQTFSTGDYWTISPGFDHYLLPVWRPILRTIGRRRDGLLPVLQLSRIITWNFSKTRPWNQLRWSRIVSSAMWTTHGLDKLDAFLQHLNLNILMRYIK